jgi:hypothetical protein
LRPHGNLHRVCRIPEELPHRAAWRPNDSATVKIALGKLFTGTKGGVRMFGKLLRTLAGGEASRVRLDGNTRWMRNQRSQIFATRTRAIPRYIEQSRGHHASRQSNQLSS